MSANLCTRWLDKNQDKVANNDFSWIDTQSWDPAVKALARFPSIVRQMSQDLGWTIDLGDAEAPQDVADVFQELRTEGERAGTLKRQRVDVCLLGARRRHLRLSYLRDQGARSRGGKG